MDERSERIIQAAVELAERDGYDAVKLRELADLAGVALATVYRRFSCKEDILAAALDQQVAVASEMMRGTVIPGDTPQERLRWFFREATDALTQQPKLSAAMLRTVASGVPELAERVIRYHGRTTEMILAVYRGGFSEDLPSESERLLATLLQNVWFAALVGWTGGAIPQEDIIEQIDAAVELLIAGMASRPPRQPRP
ncbi:MAG: AcrR family transcriptional regulator [Myxococcota bacterium]|jgi:AcrR family transcriptional regulator